jgi:hypothetical protein
MEGFLKGTAFVAATERKRQTQGGNTGKEKNDSDFARARSLVLKRSWWLLRKAARARDSKISSKILPK